LQSLYFKSKTLLLSATTGYPVIRSRNLNFTALAGFDYIDSNTDVFGTEKFSRDKLRVVHATGVFDFRDGWWGSNAASASLRQGLQVLNATRRRDEYKSRPDGTGSATLVRGSFSRLQGLYGNITFSARPLDSMHSTISSPTRSSMSEAPVSAGGTTRRR
jgi:hemolysin activation/secretion protein